MATELLAVHQRGQVEVAIGRASDYFGPRGEAQSNLGERVLGAALAGRTARVLGDLDQPHTYTYIPDIGEGLAVLGEHPDAPGEVWHLPNDPDTHSTRRELLEMRYQFEEPFIVDSSKMAIRLGARATPYERALAESLAAYGRAAEPEAKVSSRTRNRTPGLRTGPAARSRGGEDAR